MRHRPVLATALAAGSLLLSVTTAAAAEIRLPASVHNLLLDAEVSGNLRAFGKGLRGRPDHVAWDPQRRRFAVASEWHEYGVGFGQDLGVVPESRPAWWMAEWKHPVPVNRILLSGVYPNQPQPETGWKIELRRGGRWVTHARGQGGWYDRSRYSWGGAGVEPVEIDAIRVSLFSPDAKTPLRSIHFRGEAGVSWIVAHVPPIDARIEIPRRRVRAGETVRLRGVPVAGEITSWTWELGGGERAPGRSVEHAFRSVGRHEIVLRFSDGRHEATLREAITVTSPVEARITPLAAPVLVGQTVRFTSEGSLGPISSRRWDPGDGSGSGEGATLDHRFSKPGVYRVTLTVGDGTHSDEGAAIVRVHEERTVRLPQVFLDTDQKNEVDDQHYLAYAVFSELDVLGVNSIHHGGGQEPVNHGEIVHVLELARRSGLPESRQPLVFRGANERLAVPASGRWQDTEPLVTAASDAILAAARGASPTNPVWVLPVGPGTNMASAILQAREEGLELEGRIRILWLGGSNDRITREFNGNNDPWSMVVVGRCGLETWIMPAPVSGRIRMDKRAEGDLYPATPLGRYLREITPDRSKSLYDPSCLAAVIAFHQGLDWVQQTDPVAVGGPDVDYRWTVLEGASKVRVVREIDVLAMKRDIFDTLNGKPRRLRPGTSR